jgi:hypothetical protein
MIDIIDSLNAFRARRCCAPDGTSHLNKDRSVVEAALVINYHRIYLRRSRSMYKLNCKFRSIFCRKLETRRSRKICGQSKFNLPIDK